MKVSWDPLIIALVLFALAALPYFHSKEGKMPRVFGVIVAAAVMFTAAGVPSLMSLAHRKADDGLILLAYVLGALIAGVLFYIIVIRGNHKERVFKRLGGNSTGGGGSTRKTSARAPHHRTAAATVGAFVFAALIVFHLGALIHAGGHGITQTYNEITQ